MIEPTVERKEIFREPGAFQADYEEINEVPYLHFSFLCKKPDILCLKMMFLLAEELFEALRDLGLSVVYSYTKTNKQSVIKFAKKLGFKEIGSQEPYIVLEKRL